MTREQILAIAVTLLTVVVLVMDAVLLPGYVLPAAMYAVPILIAAYLLSPRLVALTSGLAIVSYLVAQLLHGTLQVASVPYLTALCLLALLASALSGKIRREAELRKGAEELTAEISRRAAEMDAVIGSIGDGVVILDAQGSVVRANAAAMEILGPCKPGLTLSEWTSSLQFRDGEGFTVTLDALPAVRSLHGEVIRGTILAINGPFDAGDEDRWVSISATPLRADGNKPNGAVMSITDLTSHHELQEQQRDILQAVSHDLRTPLTAIQGHAQMLVRLEERGDKDALMASTRAIVDGTTRMNSMIQELVDAARLSSREVELDPEPLDLAQFTRDLVDRLSGSMDTTHVRVDSPDRLPRVLADGNGLERVLTNLLSNALKYSDPGADVVVRFSTTDGQVIVSVSDRGPGIAPEEMHLLFRRFGRTSTGRQRRESVGLGLFITRRLVEAQGGRIWVESAPGQGSTFRFTLPSVDRMFRSR